MTFLFQKIISRIIRQITYRHICIQKSQRLPFIKIKFAIENFKQLFIIHSLTLLIKILFYKPPICSVRNKMLSNI